MKCYRNAILDILGFSVIATYMQDSKINSPSYVTHYFDEAAFTYCFQQHCPPEQCFKIFSEILKQYFVIKDNCNVYHVHNNK